MPSRIRFASSRDAERLTAIYAPLVAQTAVSFEETPPDGEAMRARILAVENRWPWLVEERDATAAGFAYAGPHRTRAAYRWSVDVSVYVAPDFQRDGIARRLYTALFRVLAAQRYHQAFAGVALPNDGSVALHRAVGFEPVGTYRSVGFKCGAWRDVLWLARPLRTFDVPPLEPRPIAALEAAEIADALGLSSHDPDLIG